MNISVALKLMYYIILLLPILLTLKYLLIVIYNIKQQYEDWGNSVWKFIWGVISIVSYGITVFFINKSIELSRFPMIDKLFYSYALIVFSLMYSLGIEDRKQYAEGKKMLLVATPLVAIIMFFMDKIF